MVESVSQRCLPWLARAINRCLSVNEQMPADDNIKNSVVAVAQVLPADVRNHLRALSECGLLREAHTGYAYNPDGWLERAGRACDSVLGTKLTNRLAKRPALEGVPYTRVNDTWVAEAFQLTLLRRTGRNRNDTALMDWRQSRLSTQAARKLHKDDRLVLAREDEALEAFQAAARLGANRLYQLPIAHYATVERVFQREMEEFPDQDLRTSRSISMAPHRVARKDEELSLANHVAVPSQFVKQSLLDVGYDESQIYLLPFGCEADWILDTPAEKNLNLFLHVGQLSIRKGTHRLLRAWKKLGAYRTCELRLIGSMYLSDKFLSDYQGVYDYIGKVPRQQLQQHYAPASCFIIPSLAEGFAVVVLESLSCGTPVVASRNSGAEGFITDGEEGLLHDAQDDEQLCEALDWMLTHPQHRIEMGRRCLNKARSWTWRDYRAAFSSYVVGLLDGTNNCELAATRREAQPTAATVASSAGEPTQ
jgi:glycosyltransferase involved in cell wall biosynthesis